MLAATGRETSAGGAISLYVHVPFCRSLCHFCACNRVITRKPELPARYLDVIEKETLHDPAELWKETLADIKSCGRYPMLAKRDLEPQFGLIPLGADPVSGLHEFYHRLTAGTNESCVNW